MNDPEELKKQLALLVAAQLKQDSRLHRLEEALEASKREKQQLKREVEAGRLLTKISEAKGQLAEIDTHMKGIRAEAWMDLCKQFDVIIQAFKAKCDLPQAAMFDTVETMMALLSGGGGPRLQSDPYKRSRGKFKKARKKYKKIDTTMTDIEGALISSPFQDIKTEEAQIFLRIKLDEGATSFDHLFADKLADLEQVSDLHQKMADGHFREAIKSYYLKEFAVTLFQQHVQNRMLEPREKGKKGKGALIEMAKFVCDTLEIPYPFKATKVTGVMSQAKTRALLDAVQAKSLVLVPELKEEMSLLSEKEEQKMLDPRLSRAELDEHSRKIDKPDRIRDALFDAKRQPKGRHRERLEVPSEHMRKRPSARPNQQSHERRPPPDPKVSAKEARKVKRQEAKSRKAAHKHTQASDRQRAMKGHFGSVRQEIDSKKTHHTPASKRGPGHG